MTLHPPPPAQRGLDHRVNAVTAAGWPRVDRGNHERWAALDEIDRRTVSGLRPVCRFRTGERVPMQSGPVVIGETVYFTSARQTWAVDASTCSLRWAARYDYRPGPPFDLRVNRGVAYLDGKLFRGANDGRVYALDALTGRELWNVRAPTPGLAYGAGCGDRPNRVAA